MIIDANGTIHNAREIDTTLDEYVIKIIPEEGSDSVYVRSGLDVFSYLKKKRSNSQKPLVIDVETPYFGYRVPVNLAELIPGLPDLLKKAGLTEESASFYITVTDKSPDEATQKACESQFKDGGWLGRAVDFKIYIINNKTGDIVSEAHTFTKPIVKTVFVKEDLDAMPEYWGAFVLDESSGNFKFVPHRVSRDGLLNVVISTYTNSVYVAAENRVVFTDVESGFWGKEFILQAAAKKLVTGVGNNYYQPNRSVTRAEFVQMIANAVYMPEHAADTKTYSDVKEGSWYYGSVMKARAAGFLEALDAESARNEFMPDKPITREEMATIIAAAARYENIAPTSGYIFLSEQYKDFDNMNRGYFEDISLVVNLKIMRGMSEEIFEPKGETTRAQAATVIINMLRVFEMID